MVEDTMQNDVVLVIMMAREAKCCIQKWLERQNDVVLVIMMAREAKCCIQKWLERQNDVVLVPSS